MREYKFNVSYNGNVTFKRVHDDHTEIVLLDFIDEIDHLVLTDSMEGIEYEPTEEFWTAVVDVFVIYDRLSRTIDEAHRRSVDRFLEISDVPYPRFLPKYEARIISVIGTQLMNEINVDKTHSGVLPDGIYEIIDTAYNKLEELDEYDDVKPPIPPEKREIY